MHGVSAGCGSKPGARQSAYYRHSPDAATVCQYLNANTEFSVCMTQDDTVMTYIWQFSNYFILFYYFIFILLNHIESCLSIFCKNLSTLVLNFVKKKEVYTSLVHMCELWSIKKPHFSKKVGLVRF